MTSMSCVRWDLPAFLVFLLLLQLLPMVLMEYEIYQACPGVSNSCISKKEHRIGILLDWVSNNGTVSIYNVFLSSQAAQAALSQVIHINNNSQILQEHQLCLMLVLYRFNDLEEMQNFAVTLSRSKARAVMSAIRDENSFSKQLNKILPHYFPTVLVSAPMKNLRVCTELLSHWIFLLLMKIYWLPLICSQSTWVGRGLE